MKSGNEGGERDEPQMKRTSQTALIGMRFFESLEKKPRSGMPASREKAWKERALAWVAVATTCERGERKMKEGKLIGTRYNTAVNLTYLESDQANERPKDVEAVRTDVAPDNLSRGVTGDTKVGRVGHVSRAEHKDDVVDETEGAGTEDGDPDGHRSGERGALDFFGNVSGGIVV